MKISLLRHSATPAPAVRDLQASASWRGAGTLAVTFSLNADFAQLKLASPSIPRRVDELWRHTCFEVFAKAIGESSYLEFNFSPSGEWAAYRFEDYRQGMSPLALISEPTIEVERGKDRFDLAATVTLPRSAQYRLALCAVIEDELGKLSYWALGHSPERPDFHHPLSFKLTLGPYDPPSLG
jgi:hypothetical protein